MPISSHYSALSSWVLMIARAIDSYGLDSENCLLNPVSIIPDYAIHWHVFRQRR